MYRQVFIKGIILLTIVLSLLPSCKQGKKTEGASIVTPQEEAKADTLQLVFAGDIMTHGPQIKAADQGRGNYDFTPSFELVRPMIERANLALANLETTFGGTPYRGYPMFSSPSSLGSALKEAGFDVLTTANNHSCDRGRYGVVNTIDVLDSLGIRTTGSYRTKAERSQRTPLIIDVRGVKLAVLAYTYGTNGLPIPQPALVDTIDLEQISDDLRRADSLGADYKIVQIHWGNEYEKHPSKRQRDLAAVLARQGVGAVIGSHPHVVQDSEWIEEEGAKMKTFVIYSLGNFISNQTSPAATRGGMLLSLELIRDRSTGKWTTRPSYQYVFVQKRTSSGHPIYRLHPVSLDSIPEGIPPSETSDLRAMQRHYKSIQLVH
ncbi:bacterial capsule synthesis protein [Porphyromonas catoniae F0037]|uniref:Bacterial capsule synthesis protein n=1 Tax=Porphyromonas catoniae F0037 TaxID=1127696 RepID=L1NDP6_9PORP|nr:CapA family protein [Porphyromonas catoniae]EKY01498.1 bacterial capsule synthesis protein [Porphyromonas catoniae F0037]